MPSCPTRHSLPRLLSLSDVMHSAPNNIPNWSAAEDNDKRVCARPLGSAPIPPMCNDCRCSLAAKVSYLAVLPISSHVLSHSQSSEPALCSSMLYLLCLLLVNCKQLWKGPVLCVGFGTNSQEREPSTRIGADPTAAILTWPFGLLSLCLSDIAVSLCSLLRNGRCRAFGQSALASAILQHLAGGPSHWRVCSVHSLLVRLDHCRYVCLMPFCGSPCTMPSMWKHTVPPLRRCVTQSGRLGSGLMCALSRIPPSVPHAFAWRMALVLCRSSPPFSLPYQSKSQG